MRSKASLTSDDPADTPRRGNCRVPQRILALTAAIWHNEHISRPVMRPLIACDH
jgi:hypothetical protein